MSPSRPCCCTVQRPSGPPRHRGDAAAPRGPLAASPCNGEQTCSPSSTRSSSLPAHPQPQQLLVFANPNPPGVVQAVHRLPFNWGGGPIFTKLFGSSGDLVSPGGGRQGSPLHSLCVLLSGVLGDKASLPKGSPHSSSSPGYSLVKY